MTRLSIISTLLSRYPLKQFQVLRVTENALTSPQFDMAKKIGHPVELLSQWVIVNGPHCSTTAEDRHITVRGFRGRRPAITAHIFVNEDDQFQDCDVFATGSKVKAKTILFRRNLY
ncbi:hypothetical protein PLEOSDRAFT_1108429 [Pleurotus ostreatus PC15]|uniref:Uncharacterized protein n=1 Tax=Pleurotus ostreatus (strain PC15) TaxID=1137138 RepID=A0A067NIM8_PLEO1|nr:hypothetical protein PLEOSDRAFT_1108429 [Pleurotus ostreatus PC15]